MANTAEPTERELKDKALKLLRRYDALRAEMRIVEQELGLACTVYGRKRGMWGYHKDRLRVEFMDEELVG